jgi:hypothetical protein
MSRLIFLFALGSCVVVPLASQGKAPALPPRAAETGLPVGTWNVEFANGVKEVCEIGKDGTASSEGKAVVKGSAVVIVYEDDRVERWTAVGKRLVVEHWFPASQFPTAAPVLGIAEPVQ